MKLDDIRDIFLQSIADSSAGITDFSQGSVIYTLARAVAAANYDMFVTLQQTIDKAYITEATGTELEKLAGSFGLTRIPGKKAIGYVLATSLSIEGISLQAGTILTNLDTTLQYVVTESITLNQRVQRRIPVEATEPGLVYNVAAGTRLVNGDNSSLVVFVGTHKTTTGEYCGAISGGKDLESDASLRQRIYDTITYKRTTTDRAVIDAVLEYDPVNTVVIEPIIQAAMNVWVDSSKILTKTDFNNIKTIVQNHKPAGVLFDVLQANPRYVDFKIKVTNYHTNLIEVSTLTGQIRQEIVNFLKDLNMTNSLFIDSLSEYLNRVITDVNLNILEPTEDVASEIGRVIRLNKLELICDA